MAKIKKDHKKEIRQLELENLIENFEDLKDKAKLSELNKFENLSKSAQRAIDINSNEFDKYIDEMHSISTNILHRQPEFFIYLSILRANRIILITKILTTCLYKKVEVP